MKNTVVSKFIRVIFTIIIAITVSYSKQPYVIMVSFDGFRYDYMNRNLTPTLDSLAKSGVRAASFKPRFPSSTFPNHQAIITGMNPENHGIILNFFKNPYTGKTYKLNDEKEVVNPIWYQGEAFWETARRNGIKTASYFWPGSEMTEEYRRSNFSEKYEHKRDYQTRVDGVINWLKLPDSTRPHFITLYFDDTDSKGHEFGINSKETNDAIKRLDGIANSLINGLKSINMADSVSLIFLSDHGMADVQAGQTIDLENILNGIKCKDVNNASTLAMIEPENADEIDAIVNKLNTNAKGYKAYRKEKMPAHFKFSKHPFIYSIVLLADEGWDIKYGKKNYVAIGQHGYDNNSINMHGFFVASGPLFRNGLKTGTIDNIDVYPLLCEIFKISPRSNIDGNINGIRFILKD